MKSLDTKAPAVALAYRLAKHAHGKQRYNSKPYIFHLEKVDAIVQRHIRLFDKSLDVVTVDDKPLPVAIRQVALLHDIIEDTIYDRTDLMALGIGKSVVDAVDILSGMRSETANNYYDRIGAGIMRNGVTASPISRQMAIVVKLADRLANMQALANVDDEKREKLCNKYMGQNNERLNQFIARVTSNYQPNRLLPMSILMMTKAEMEHAALVCGKVN